MRPGQRRTAGGLRHRHRRADLPRMAGPVVVAGDTADGDGRRLAGAPAASPGRGTRPVGGPQRRPGRAGTPGRADRPGPAHLAA